MILLQTCFHLSPSKNWFHSLYQVLKCPVLRQIAKLTAGKHLQIFVYGRYAETTVIADSGFAPDSLLGSDLDNT